MSSLVKLPSSINLIPNVKKIYTLPLLKSIPRGKLRRNPHDRPRVQSPKFPKRYSKSANILIKKRSIQKLEAMNIDVNKFHHYVAVEKDKMIKEQGFTNTTERQHLNSLQLLNTFKFNTPSYKRFTAFYNTIKDIDDTSVIVTKKFKFLLEEVKREVKEPNADEITPEYLRDFAPQNKEEYQYVLEKQLRRAAGLQPVNARYKCSAELLNVLEYLQATNSILKVSVNEFKEVFEASLFIQDDDLASAVRIIAGRALFALGKIDDLSLDKHYNLITALIENDQLGDAQALIERNPVERPMWYHLRASLAIKCGNMDAAENWIEKTKELFKVKFVQSDIYVLIIKRYVFGDNFERADYWRKEFEACIEQRGFTRDNYKLPYFVAPPKEKCEYLDKFHPLGGITYLIIIGFYIALKPLNHKVQEMIEFYLKQPNTKPKDLENVILSFRYELSTKIKPHLEKLKNRQAEKYLLSFIEQFQKQHPLVALQEEFKDELLNELAELGGFQTITHIIETTIEQKQKPKDTHFTSLLTALLKRDKVEQAFKILEALENSHLIVQSDPQNIELRQDQLLPSVNAHHYAAFLKYYSNNRDFEGFNSVIERFKEVHLVYNTVFLNQILTTLWKNDKIEEAFKYVDEILLENIHLQDPTPPVHGYLRLYTTVWKLIKDLSFMSSKQNVEVPNIRYVFMKMIHDNVIPTDNLYDTILSVFINEKDYYGAICVLQYLGKVHRTLPHKYTCAKIKKLCKFVKFDNNARNVIPAIDPNKRFEVGHQFQRYQESFEEIKQKTSRKVSLDPFAPQSEGRSPLSGHPRDIERYNDPADQVWKILLYQMMTVVRSQYHFDNEELIRTHDDFGLDYEADRIVKEQEEIQKVKHERSRRKKEMKEQQHLKMQHMANLNQ